MNKNDAIDYLKRTCDLVLQSRCIPVLLTAEWQKSFNEEPGVYCIYENDKMIYVGQTDNFRKRMGDLRRTVNHTLRRSLGEYLYCKHEKFEKATAKKRFHDDIELLLNNYMIEKLTISCFTEYLGRLELENFVIKKNGLDNLYNLK